MLKSKTHALMAAPVFLTRGPKQILIVRWLEATTAENEAVWAFLPLFP